MQKKDVSEASTLPAFWRDPQVLKVGAGTVIVLLLLWTIMSQNFFGAKVSLSSSSAVPLRQAIHDATTRAHLSSSLSSRALSRPTFKRDGGLDFTLCHADLSSKDAASNINELARAIPISPISGSSGGIDPFSPEGRNPELYVASLVVSMKDDHLSSIALDYAPAAPVAAPTAPAPRQPESKARSKSYSLLLNKFNTVADHSLLVTDVFEPQTSPLDRLDVVAWYHAVNSCNAVGLFNSDSVAGASQRHKHVQVIPLDSFWPLRPTDAIYPLPLDHVILPAIIAGTLSPPSCGTLRAGLYPTHTLALWPFKHRFAVISGIGARHEEEREEGRECLYSKAFAAYSAVLADLGVDAAAAPASASASASAAASPASYNVVLTKHYVLAVLRSRPSAGLDSSSSASSSSSSSVTVKVNGFGFLGMLLGRDAAAVEEIAAAGPMSVLRQVGVE